MRIRDTPLACLAYLMAACLPCADSLAAEPVQIVAVVVASEVAR
jgi:hypothetical protein